MEPNARVERCLFQWERTLLKFCGHNFIGEPFKPNLITYFLYCLIIITILSCAYTIAYYDMTEKLFSVMALLIIIQVNFYFHMQKIISKSK